MTKDRNKWLNISYNYLNLPSKLTTMVGGFSSDKVEYLYDATGNKLAKMVGGTNNLYEYYMGDVVLKKTVPTDAFSVEYLLMPEGRVDYSPTSGIYTYEFHLKDHLGNTRVAYIASGGVASTVQQADYYPFGMKIASTLYENNTNKYLYNGKELQDNTLGNINLDWYDYGARMYDAQLGRFHTPDPLSEYYYKLSNYNYAGNNPIRFIDVDGLGPGDRIFLSQSFYGTPYKQETISALRTGNDAKALAYSDCAEHVCRVMAGDGITDGVQHMNSGALEQFYTTSGRFVEIEMDQLKPGDFIWTGSHNAIFAGFTDDGKLRLSHSARYELKDEKGNITKSVSTTLEESYKRSWFTTRKAKFYRPINETPDVLSGKVIINGGTKDEVTVTAKGTERPKPIQIQNYITPFQQGRLHPGDSGYLGSYWDAYDAAKNF